MQHSLVGGVSTALAGGKTFDCTNTQPMARKGPLRRAIYSRGKRPLKRGFPRPLAEGSVRFCNPIIESCLEASGPHGGHSDGLLGNGSVFDGGECRNGPPVVSTISTERRDVVPMADFQPNHRMIGLFDRFNQLRSTENAVVVWLVVNS